MASPNWSSFACQRKRFNPSDAFVVAMLHDVVVGHVPQVISAVCSAFTRIIKIVNLKGSRDGSPQQKVRKQELQIQILQYLIPTLAKNTN